MKERQGNSSTQRIVPFSERKGYMAKIRAEKIHKCLFVQTNQNPALKNLIFPRDKRERIVLKKVPHM